MQKNIEYKCDETNKREDTLVQRKTNNDAKVVKNIEKILAKLESSLHISSSLEEQLMLNAGSMAHRHKHLDIGQDFVLEEREKKDNDLFFSKAPTSISNSFSIKSIDTIKHQHKELSSKYQDLLKNLSKTYVKCVKNTQQDDPQKQILDLTQKIDELNETITKICSKYFVLKRRKDEQKMHFEKQISSLRHCTEKVLELLQNSRMENALLTKNMTKDSNTLKDSLFKEVRRSKHLYQENLFLKRKLEQISSGCFTWNSSLKST